MKTSKNISKKPIIIGAGLAGLTAACEFIDKGKQYQLDIQPVILEKTDRVGGKCKTYTNKDGIKAEWGACAIASQYKEILKLMDKYDLKLEAILPIEQQTLEVKEKFRKRGFFEKIWKAGTLLSEIRVFNSDCERYFDALDAKTELPKDLDISYSEYKKLRHIEELDALLKPIVPGFNYNELLEPNCRMDQLFQYIGEYLLYELLFIDNILKGSPMSVIQGGFQQLPEKMAKGLDVRFGVEVKNIKREKGLITVCYKQGEDEISITGDSLILAINPGEWNTLGLELTNIETECVKTLEVNKYPVIMAEVSGLEAKQYYVPRALEKSGYGYISFLASRDGRDTNKGPHLYSVYINTLANTEFKFSSDEELIEEIKQIKGVTDVTILDKTIWNYNPRLPYKTRLALYKEEEASNTLHLGAYAFRGFELTESIVRQAKMRVAECFGEKVVYDRGIDWNYLVSRVKHAPQSTSKSELSTLSMFSSKKDTPDTSFNGSTDLRINKIN